MATGKKKPAGRLKSDQETLAKKAAMAKELELEAGAIADKARALKDEVRDGMKRAGIKAIEQRVGDDMVRISLATPESTVYDEAKILAAVKRRRPELVSKVTRTTVSLDFSKLLTEVQRGKVPMGVIERNSSVVERTPYVTITIKDP